MIGQFAQIIETTFILVVKLKLIAIRAWVIILMFDINFKIFKIYVSWGLVYNLLVGLCFVFRHIHL